MFSVTASRAARRIGFIGIGLAIATSTAAQTEYFTITKGKLDRPTGYREWIYVGSPLTPDPLNGGRAAFPGFHNVYIDPTSWAYWKRAGKFRDGTILVKELVSVGTRAAPSGQGYFQGEYIGLEAAIKSTARYPDEPGNWAYFRFSSPDHRSLAAQAAPSPTADCNQCHAASAADDFVFTQYYPVLRAGKEAGGDAVGGTRSKLGGR